MTTRTKLYISSYTGSIMLLLNVFSKPLHIPEAFQWVLVVGVFVPLGLTFHFMRRQKQELGERALTTDRAAPLARKRQQNSKKRLVLAMALGSIVGLCSPFWLPLTGTTLGMRGDFIVGLVTAAMVCAIVGFRLRKI